MQSKGDARSIKKFGLFVPLLAVIAFMMMLVPGQALAGFTNLSPTGTIPNGNTTISATFWGYPEDPSVTLDGVARSCTINYFDTDSRWINGYGVTANCPVSGLVNGSHTYTVTLCEYYEESCDMGQTSETVTFCVGACSTDTTPPVTTDNAPAGWQNHNVTVTLSCSDGSGSGCAATTYELDGGATQTGNTVVVSTYGTHAITYRSTDNAGNVETTRTATVQIDKTAPVLSMPGDITAEATGPAGAVVTYSVTASDPDDTAGPAVCSPASGSTFPLGNTTVNCSASDTHGNASAGSFTVTVEDTTAPVLDLPEDVYLVTPDPGGAVVTYTASAADAVYGPVTHDCSPASGSTFPVGSTEVTCSAQDDSGNTASGNFNVTVTYCDTGKPDLSLGLSSIYWASFANYEARILTLDYSITNSTAHDALNMSIVGTVNSNGVTLSHGSGGGDIPAGGSVGYTLNYQVPGGVAAFTNTVYARAYDQCLNFYEYPGPWPGA